MNNTSEPTVVAGVKIHREITIGNVVSIMTTVLTGVFAVGGLVWAIATWAGETNARLDLLDRSFVQFKLDVNTRIDDVQSSQRSSDIQTQNQLRDLRQTVDKILLQRHSSSDPG